MKKIAQTVVVHKKTFTIKTAWNNFKSIIESRLGWNREDLEEDYRQAISIHKGLSVNDYFWGLLNRLVIKTKGGSDVYNCMAGFVNAYEGKSGLKYDELRIMTEVGNGEYRETSFVMGYIASCGKEGCEHAQSMLDNRFTREEAMENKAGLAGKNCSNQRCHCWYAYLALRNSNGRLVLKEDN